MAGKSSKSKEPSAIAKLYLKTYNLLQTVGWSYILYQVLNFYIVGVHDTTLWQFIDSPLIIFQTAAILEILHTITGLVPSNPVLTAFQVASRLMIVYAVILATPLQYAASSMGVPLCLLAWSVTEIIRYSYYFLNSLGFIPKIVIWARYTFFIALYPIGVTGELLCAFAAERYAAYNPRSLSYKLPNEWNFTFSYQYLMVIFMLLYIPLFPQLYLHMFAQRRKVLGQAGKTQKVQ